MDARTTATNDEIAIHASVKQSSDDKLMAEVPAIAKHLPGHHTMLPRGKIVGVARLVSVKPALMVYEMIIEPQQIADAAEFCTWDHDWWAWEFENATALMNPIVLDGRNRPWELDSVIESEIVGQLLQQNKSNQTHETI
jgi:hypothetical protein